MKTMILSAMLFVSVQATAFAKLQVFACEPEWAALASELAGEQAEIYQATSAQQDPHHIEARPSLIARMRRADLLVCTGAGLEAGWLPLVIRQSSNDRITEGQPGRFLAALQVARLEIPEHVDRSMGDVHAQGNPHVHLDPRRLLKIATALSARLQELDPSQRPYYQQRYQRFRTQWQAAMGRWETAAAPLRGIRVAVYHRDSVYLFDWLGMRIVATLEPKPGIAPGAGYLASVKQALQQQPADMVVYAAYQDKRAAQWLSREMGIPLVELPFTVGGSRQADSLQALFDDTIHRLLAARGNTT